MGSLKTFPVSAVVAGRRVVVVGGDEAAAAKLRLLAKTQAEVQIYAPAPAACVRLVALEEGYALHERLPEAREFSGAALAFIATEDEGLDRYCAKLARDSGVTVNVVDRPDLCDVLTPAIIDRAPLTIAISTEGAAPVLAGLLRTRIESLLPPGLGALTRFAGGLRGRVAETLPPGIRRLAFWRRYFAGEEMADAAAHGEAAIRRRAMRLLDQAREAEAGPGMVWLVGAGPGAADLLTIRAQRVLSEADVVVHDRLVHPAVFDHVRRDARRIDVGKRKGQAVATQDDINEILVAEARDGNRVVRLKAGDPMIYGRAGEEIAALREAAIAHAVVPGITAALGAAAETATPLTHRAHASALIFATGHAAHGTQGIDWAQVARTDVTLTLYMACSSANEVAASLMEAGLPGDTPAGAVENATRIDARRFFGRLDTLGALAGRRDIDGPVVIFVGRAVAEGEWAGAPGFASTGSLAA